ncbi:MAG: protein-export chaperone SecB [Bacteroidota bacterium]|nr:protein-export chaperone SecB [Bacteroidota bacterium]
MKARQSSLKLLGFNIFKSSIDFVSTENPEEVNLYSLPIDIDFDIFEPKDEEDFHRIGEIKLKVNPSGKKPGYSIELTASGFFELTNPEKFEKEIKENLLGISIVNILIGNIRGYLKNVTSYGAYGPYLLPSIDMSHLLKQKSKQASDQS